MSPNGRGFTKSLSLRTACSSWRWDLVNPRPDNRTSKRSEWWRHNVHAFPTSPSLKVKSGAYIALMLDPDKPGHAWLLGWWMWRGMLQPCPIPSPRWPCSSAPSQECIVRRSYFLMTCKMLHYCIYFATKQDFPSFCLNLFFNWIGGY